MARFTDALIVVAERDIAKGLQAGIGVPQKYHLIRSAIPLEEFRPSDSARRLARQEFGIPAEAVVVGNVGRFSTQKNPLDWVRAAGKISRENHQARFLLVGDGPLRQQVEEEIRRQGISERTIMTGLRRDVPHMLAAMDIFMLSSLWEGLPRVIPQAMAMRLPVIANRADGTNEVIDDGITGYLCPPGDVEKLADFCLRLLFDPVKRQEMGARGRIVATQEFDLHKMIQQIEELYAQLLS
jgi:glycosyltransferase involved in cell wall biosynthesis